MPKKRTTGPRATKTAERRAQAMNLRISGLSFEQIGKELGISGVAAYQHVKHGLETARAKLAEAAESVREQEIRRLDRALLVVMAILGKADRPAADRLAAVDRLIKIQERRARYLGLDAPERYEHAAPGGVPLLAPVILLPPEDAPGEEPPRLIEHAPYGAAGAGQSGVRELAPGAAPEPSGEPFPTLLPPDARPRRE